MGAQLAGSAPRHFRALNGTGSPGTAVAGTEVSGPGENFRVSLGIGHALEMERSGAAVERRGSRPERDLSSLSLALVLFRTA